MLKPILFQILLEDENFNEALNLLVQAVSERIQLDVLLFNTILQKACDKVLNCNYFSKNSLAIFISNTFCHYFIINISNYF